MDRQVTDRARLFSLSPLLSGVYHFKPQCVLFLILLANHKESLPPALGEYRQYNRDKIKHILGTTNRLNIMAGPAL